MVSISQFFNCLLANTEAFLNKMNKQKRKQLQFSQSDNSKLYELIRITLDIYSHKYGHTLLIGDFNLEINER